MKTYTSFKSIVLLLALLFVNQLSAEEFYVLSPDGALKVKVSVSETVTYEVSHNDVSLVLPSKISMTLDNGLIVGVDGTMKNTERLSINEIIPVLLGKNKSLDDNYNQLTINFDEKYSLIFRAYNEGAAYRFVTELDNEVIVKSEEANFILADNPAFFFPEADAKMQNFERLYKPYAGVKDVPIYKYCNVPAMASYSEGSYKVVIAESDLLDYPGMYLHGNGVDGLKGYWPKYPNKVKDPDDIYVTHEVLSRFDYLAKTKGTRSYPWRVLIVSSDDKDLLNNGLIFKLATPQISTDTDWIKAGKSTWEWWHKAMLEGVSFPIGNDNLGFDLYKYYVDFASANNIEFLTLDAGWSDSYISRLCSYAKGKNVGIFVWTWANIPVQDPTWLPKMKKAGISGVKVDFFDRDDQIAINWMEQVAKDCAENQLLLLYHGCPKPTGLHRTYPHIVNYEAVRGAECNFWDRDSDPDYHLQFPFIRMLAGPIDYTPGSMRNKTKLQFIPVDKPNIVPSSMGTRAHELAMYVLFDQPLGFLCDAPTEYAKYPDILDFLSRVPTIWNKTVPLDAKMGEYALIAKQTGKEWYVSGMSNWDSRAVDVDFSFLPEGVKFKATVYKDNTNSDNYPTRYVCEEIIVNNETQLNIRMAKGGGFVMRLYDETPLGVHSNNVDSDSFAYFDRINQRLNVQSNDFIKLIEIIDISGNSKICKVFKNNSKAEQIDIPDLPKGVYVVRIKTQYGTNSLKFIY